MLYLLTYLFSKDPNTWAKAESYFSILSEEAEHLEHVASNCVLAEFLNEHTGAGVDGTFILLANKNYQDVRESS